MLSTEDSKISYLSQIWMLSTKDRKYQYLGQIVEATYQLKIVKYHYISQIMNVITEDSNTLNKVNVISHLSQIVNAIF